ncbi:MAG: hypothetical protein ACM31L_12585 [Actinomycetota bacterium]
MFGRKAPRVQVGDRFVKTGGSRKVWTVVELSAAHAQLASDQPTSEHITIAVNALVDSRLFLPATPQKTAV